MENRLDYETNFTIPERPSGLPNKLLVGAGPANPSPRVVFAMSSPTMGTSCPEIYQMMDDIKVMLQYLFQTKNDVTLALQTSGTGGLEAALCNIVDPGDTVIVAISGYWGHRMAEKAKIRNAKVVCLESAPGETFTLEHLEKEIAAHKPVALFVTHGESSGGTLQNLEGLGKMCHKYDCLLVVDAVVSLGGVPFYTDRWEVDVAVSASQKAVGAPPGMSLITMNSRAVNRMRSIKCPPPFYFNIVKTCLPWNLLHEKRFYYITYNSHLLSALREALIEIAEEGLLKRWERHRTTADRFWSGLKKLGMDFVVETECSRLSTVTCCLPPAGIYNQDLVEYLLEKYQVCIAFGITSSTKNALRIGLMGYNARTEVVDYVLKVLKEAIEHCKNEKLQNGLV